MTKTYVFYISDSTGITAQTLGQSVITQFEGIEFESIVLPYVDSVEKAHDAVKRINQAFNDTGMQPIVFDTIINPAINEVMSSAKALSFDVLTTYLKPIERALNIESTFTVGRAHGISENEQYKDRINAVHFAMENDDGAKTRYYDEADVILIGVSRCGKTPTSLYLALQFGIYAANYPITEDDMDELKLPNVLKAHKKKLFGLTIDPDRLAIIRNERKSSSRYASLKQCEYEVSEVEALYRRYGISCINTTYSSIEEIASKVLAVSGIDRKT